VLEDLASGSEIASATERLLRHAEADGRLPTPVEDLVTAAELRQPEESVLSDSAISQAPAHLRKAMAKLRRKVSAVLDRRAKEIHISPEIQHEGRRRFKQVHEISHHILPWQSELAYADDCTTLSWSTRSQFEREANQGGAELLFQRRLFTEMAAQYKIGFGAIVDLANQFGSSYHAAFRRFIETHRRPMAGFVLESSPCRIEPSVGYKRREAINSKAWPARFDPAVRWPRILHAPPYDFVKEIPRVNGFVPPRVQLSYPDLNGEIADLNVELFSNTYDIFALIWVPQRERLKRERVIVESTPS
jgi:Zn-dependent peptidase ImmA (M78 family)